MRDIREDLRQRLSALRKERDDLQAQLKTKLAEIANNEEVLDRLLEMEEERLGGQVPVGTPSRPKTEKTTAEISAEFEADILEVLEDGRSRSHAEIKTEMEAKGWISTDKSSVGRKIQGVLLGLSRNRGIVEFMGDSVWRKVTKESASAA